jgi:hypothetical protein
LYFDIWDEFLIENKKELKEYVSTTKFYNWYNKYLELRSWHNVYIRNDSCYNNTNFSGI